jgi:hypothetical protein
MKVIGFRVAFRCKIMTIILVIDWANTRTSRISKDLFSKRAMSAIQKRFQQKLHYFSRALMKKPRRLVLLQEWVT